MLRRYFFNLYILEITSAAKNPKNPSVGSLLTFCRQRLENDRADLAWRVKEVRDIYISRCELTGQAEIICSMADLVEHAG